MFVIDNYLQNSFSEISSIEIKNRDSAFIMSVEIMEVPLPMSIKIESDNSEDDDIIILDEKYNSPELIPIEWHLEIMKLLSRRVERADNNLVSIMKEYIERLQDRVIHFEDTEKLHTMVARHIEQFYLLYKDLDDFFKDLYLGCMESIMTFYVNLSLRVLLKLKNKMKVTKRMVDDTSQKIIRHLKFFLLDTEYYISHVLIRQTTLKDEMVKDVNNILNSNICKQVFRNFYMHFLVLTPREDLSDEAFCRAFILFENWKAFESPGQDREIDQCLKQIFKKDTLSFENNDFLKKILQPPASKKTQFMAVVGCHSAITKSYFDYIKSKKDAEAEILEDIGNLAISATSFSESEDEEDDGKYRKITDKLLGDSVTLSVTESIQVKEERNVTFENPVINCESDSDSDVEFVSIEDESKRLEKVEIPSSKASEGKSSRLGSCVDSQHIDLENGTCNSDRNEISTIDIHKTTISAPSNVEPNQVEGTKNTCITPMDEISMCTSNPSNSGMINVPKDVEMNDLHSEIAQNVPKKTNSPTEIENMNSTEENSRSLTQNNSTLIERKNAIVWKSTKSILEDTTFNSGLLNTDNLPKVTTGRVLWEGSKNDVSKSRKCQSNLKNTRARYIRSFSKSSVTEDNSELISHEAPQQNENLQNSEPKSTENSFNSEQVLKTLEEVQENLDENPSRNETYPVESSDEHTDTNIPHSKDLCAEKPDQVNNMDCTAATEKFNEVEETKNHNFNEPKSTENSFNSEQVLKTLEQVQENLDENPSRNEMYPVESSDEHTDTNIPHSKDLCAAKPDQANNMDCTAATEKFNEGEETKNHNFNTAYQNHIQDPNLQEKLVIINNSPTESCNSIQSSGMEIDEHPKPVEENLVVVDNLPTDCYVSIKSPEMEINKNPKLVEEELVIINNLPTETCNPTESSEMGIDIVLESENTKTHDSYKDIENSNMGIEREIYGVLFYNENGAVQEEININMDTPNQAEYHEQSDFEVVSTPQNLIVSQKVNKHSNGKLADQVNEKEAEDQTSIRGTKIPQHTVYQKDLYLNNALLIENESLIIYGEVDQLAEFGGENNLNMHISGEVEIQDQNEFEIDFGLNLGNENITVDAAKNKQLSEIADGDSRQTNITCSLKTQEQTTSEKVSIVENSLVPENNVMNTTDETVLDGNFLEVCRESTNTNTSCAYEHEANQSTSNDLPQHNLEDQQIEVTINSNSNSEDQFVIASKQPEENIERISDSNFEQCSQELNGSASLSDVEDRTYRTLLQETDSCNKIDSSVPSENDLQGSPKKQYLMPSSATEKTENDKNESLIQFSEIEDGDSTETNISCSLKTQQQTAPQKILTHGNSLMPENDDVNTIDETVSNENFLEIARESTNPNTFSEHEHEANQSAPNNFSQHHLEEDPQIEVKINSNLNSEVQRSLKKQYLMLSSAAVKTENDINESLILKRPLRRNEKLKKTLYRLQKQKKFSLKNYDTPANCKASVVEENLMNYSSHQKLKEVISEIHLHNNLEVNDETNFRECSIAACGHDNSLTDVYNHVDKNKIKDSSHYIVLPNSLSQAEKALDTGQHVSTQFLDTGQLNNEPVLNHNGSSHESKANTTSEQTLMYAAEDDISAQGFQLTKFPTPPYSDKDVDDQPDLKYSMLNGSICDYLFDDGTSADIRKPYDSSERSCSPNSDPIKKYVEAYPPLVGQDLRVEPRYGDSNKPSKNRPEVKSRSRGNKSNLAYFKYTYKLQRGGCCSGRVRVNPSKVSMDDYKLLNAHVPLRRLTDDTLEFWKELTMQSRSEGAGQMQLCKVVYDKQTPKNDIKSYLEPFQGSKKKPSQGSKKKSKPVRKVTIMEPTSYPSANDIRIPTLKNSFPESETGHSHPSEKQIPYDRRGIEAKPAHRKTTPTKRGNDKPSHRNTTPAKRGRKRKNSESKFPEPKKKDFTEKTDSLEGSESINSEYAVDEEMKSYENYSISKSRDTWEVDRTEVVGGGVEFENHHKYSRRRRVHPKHLDDFIIHT